MMERLLTRGRAIAARRIDEMLGLIEQAARDELPSDLLVLREEDRIVVTGSGLKRRLLSDARLRGIGLLVRGLIR